MAATSLPATDMESFHAYLRPSKRIVALLGAGLSAASGLPTFRGAGGLWRNHDAMSLATPEAFERDPALVWRFYSYRRHHALRANPNPAHYALAALAKAKPHFVTLSQNVDGLSPRAGHPPDRLHLLHGSLFDLRCTSFFCDYLERDNFKDPLVPALDAQPSAADQQNFVSPEIPGGQPTDASKVSHSHAPDISDAAVNLNDIDPKDLPHCPRCHRGLLRPGVVWFGEALPATATEAADAFVRDHVDLMLVIGTSARVYPAAGYVERARASGAKVAVVNTDPADMVGSGGDPRSRPPDWFFEGDAAEIVPRMLEPVIGAISVSPTRS